MNDPLSAARDARQMLQQALAALQTPGVPPQVMEVAEPVAQAMGALFKIESSQGAELAQNGPAALQAVRSALALLQRQPGGIPAVDQATEAVAGSLSVVHGISRAAETAAQPAPQQPAPQQPQAAYAQPPAQQPQPAPAFQQPAYAQPPAQQPQPAYVQPPAQQPQPAYAQPPAQQPQPAYGQPQMQPQPAPAPQQPAFAQPAQPQPVPADATGGTVVMPPNADAGAYGPPPAQTSPSPGGYAPAQPSPAAQPAYAATVQAAPGMPQPSPQAAPATGAQPAWQQPAPQPSPVQPQATPMAQPAQPGGWQGQRDDYGPAPQQAQQAPAGAGWEQPQPQAPAPQPAPPAGHGPPVRVEAELGAHSSTNFYKGLSGNDVIESGGIFVATYQVPKIGQNLVLKVSMPGGYEFEAMGVVRWTREGSGADPDAPPGFGAQFTQISPEGRQLVYRYVRNREPLFHDDL